MGVATIFSTTGLCRPSVLVKRIRRLSRDCERERVRRLTSARFFANLRSEGNVEEARTGTIARDDDFVSGSPVAPEILKFLLLLQFVSCYNAIY